MQVTPEADIARNNFLAGQSGRSGSGAGLNGVQMTTGVPPIPTISAMTGERRRDRSKTEHHPALQRNVGQ